MPTLLVKTGRVPRASALETRPVLLPLKTAPPTWRRRGFSRQSEGRHNTLYFASGKVCAKGLRPLWKPRRSGCASREMSRSRAPFPLQLAACPAALRGVRTEGTTGTGRGHDPRRNKKSATTDFSRRGVFCCWRFRSGFVCSFMVWQH